MNLIAALFIKNDFQVNSSMKSVSGAKFSGYEISNDLLARLINNRIINRSNKLLDNGFGSKTNIIYPFIRNFCLKSIQEQSNFLKHI